MSDTRSSLNKDSADKVGETVFKTLLSLTLAVSVSDSLTALELFTPESRMSLILGLFVCTSPAALAVDSTSTFPSSSLFVVSRIPLSENELELLLSIVEELGTKSDVFWLTSVEPLSVVFKAPTVAEIKRV